MTTLSDANVCVGVGGIVLAVAGWCWLVVRHGGGSLWTFSGEFV